MCLTSMCQINASLRLALLHGGTSAVWTLCNTSRMYMLSVLRACFPGGSSRWPPSMPALPKKVPMLRIKESSRDAWNPLVALQRNSGLLSRRSRALIRPGTWLHQVLTILPIIFRRRCPMLGMRWTIPTRRQMVRCCLSLAFGFAMRRCWMCCSLGTLGSRRMGCLQPSFVSVLWSWLQCFA